MQLPFSLHSFKALAMISASVEMHSIVFIQSPRANLNLHKMHSELFTHITQNSLFFVRSMLL